MAAAVGFICGAVYLGRIRCALTVLTSLGEHAGKDQRVLGYAPEELFDKVKNASDMLQKNHKILSAIRL